jgi:hypothetical protein
MTNLARSLRITYRFIENLDVLNYNWIDLGCEYTYVKKLELRAEKDTRTIKLCTEATGCNPVFFYSSNSLVH